MSRSRQLSVYLVASCLALAACGGDDPDDARPQPTTTAPSTTQPQDPDEQALRSLAEDWYEAYSEEFETQGSGEVANEFLTDPYLSQFLVQLEDLRQSGNKTLGSDESRQVIEDVEVEGDRGTVTECLVNANVLVDADGGVINDDVNTRRLETRAVRTEAGWRFSERVVIEELEGGDQCDA